MVALDSNESSILFFLLFNEKLLLLDHCQGKIKESIQFTLNYTISNSSCFIYLRLTVLIQLFSCFSILNQSFLDSCSVHSPDSTGAQQLVQFTRAMCSSSVNDLKIYKKCSQHLVLLKSLEMIKIWNISEALKITIMKHLGILFT